MSYFRELLLEKDTVDNLWKTTMKIVRFIFNTTYIRKEIGPWARNNKQKADLFAESLAETMLPRMMDEEADLDYTDNHNSKKDSASNAGRSGIERKTNLYKKKAPGFELINGTILDKEWLC